MDFAAPKGIIGHTRLVMENTPSKRIGDILVKNGELYVWTGAQGGFQIIESPQAEEDHAYELSPVICKCCGAPITKIGNFYQCKYCDTMYHKHAVENNF